MSLRTASVVNSSGEWHLEFLNEWLPIHVVYCIRLMEPPHPRLGRYGWKWNQSQDENATLKEVSKVLLADNEPDNASHWLFIWKSDLPIEFKAHLWLIQHGGLMTNEARRRQTFTENDTWTRGEGEC